MERIPPHNLEAERSTLGAAMLSKDALMDVSEEVKPEDFYSEKQQRNFRSHYGALSQQFCGRYAYCM